LINIKNKGEELDLGQATSFCISFKKPDGTRVFQDNCQPVNVLKGKYQIVLKTQTLASIGNVLAQVHITENDRIIDTQQFVFVVKESLASDEAIESTNEFGKSISLNKHIGKQVTVLDSANFTLLNDIVDVEGVTFNIVNNYGYAVLKVS
ncbi:BppU family phage baseplate upper protein, partial [Bacillus sp. C30]|uniref:BppU family phage baseplate upper protein n=1 Tax=Bacillus sp. C30 TaxID=1387733 RepID=UPI00349F5712